MCYFKHTILRLRDHTFDDIKREKNQYREISCPSNRYKGISIFPVKIQRLKPGESKQYLCFYNPARDVAIDARVSVASYCTNRKAFWNKINQITRRRITVEYHRSLLLQCEIIPTNN